MQKEKDIVNKITRKKEDMPIVINSTVLMQSADQVDGINMRLS